MRRVRGAATALHTYLRAYEINSSLYHKIDVGRRILWLNEIRTRFSGFFYELDEIFKSSLPRLISKFYVITLIISIRIACTRLGFVKMDNFISLNISSNNSHCFVIGRKGFELNDLGLFL